MKYAFLASLLVYAASVNAQLKSVADFTTGKTTLTNFYKLADYDTLKSNIISSESRYESLWVPLYNDSVYHEMKTYEVKFDKKNLEDYGWKLTAPNNSQTKVFYITQIQLPAYLVNNLLLTFYQNILIKVEYDLPANLFDSLALNNQKAGDSSTETKTLSRCTNLKSYNISKTATINDPGNNSQSTLEYIYGTDAACKPYSHFNIKIIDQQNWQQYLTDAKASLIPNQQRLTREYMAQKLAELEAEQDRKSKKKK